MMPTSFNDQSPNFMQKWLGVPGGEVLPGQKIPAVAQRFFVIGLGGAPAEDPGRSRNRAISPPPTRALGYADSPNLALRSCRGRHGHDAFPGRVATPSDEASFRRPGEIRFATAFRLTSRRSGSKHRGAEDHPDHPLDLW